MSGLSDRQIAEKATRLRSAAIVRLNGESGATQTPVKDSRNKYIAGRVSRVRLVIGLLFLFNASSNFFFSDPDGLSTGRWSWVYRAVTSSFGPYGYPIFQVIIGCSFIAWSLRKTQTK